MNFSDERELLKTTMKGESMEETITAWFSYAGAQHKQVVEICEWLKPDKVEGLLPRLKHQN
jgi:hypothetical protein